MIKRNKYIFLAVICFLILLSSCSSVFKTRTPEEKEFNAVVRYLTDNSGSDEIKVISKSVDLLYTNEVRIDFTGVKSLEQVDNIAYAFNQYLADNPDCFINANKMKIDITFYSVDRKNMDSGDHKFAEVWRPVYHDDVDSEFDYNVGINWIRLYITPEFPITDFIHCKTHYKGIIFSQAVTIEDIESATELFNLESMCMSEVWVESAPENETYDFHKLDYETYVNYCDAFNRINSEKGYRFADIHISKEHESEWKEEYGDAFVMLDEY